MKIQPITPFYVNNYIHTKKQQNKVDIRNNAYNPIAYNDLTFTGRLFRSPEEFYTCSFNKNGMPEIMKQYLNADYEDRQHMPPQQMLALVFADINETKNLEQVKRSFPDEPLFKNLTDTPNKKAQKGILAEIELMKDENKSLFKNGDNNLGHYILKKIYIEGKTLKEINADFDKDKSVYYSALEPIKYETVWAFGIKFPNAPFWRSFTYNRENFNFTYTPRRPIKSSAASNINKSTVSKATHQRNNRFGSVKDWEIDKLAEALNKGNGNINETQKQLRKSSVRDEASLNFVAKYMGEINSVVLEKLHVSPEMIDFFDNPEILSKSQKQKMDIYWQEPERHELRSIIMKDTIKLFFEAYGEDGQNDDFKELLEYAHSIKPARIAQQQEHNRIQDEYDKMFAELDAEENKSASLLANAEQKSVPELLDDVINKFDVDVFKFDVDGNELVIVSKLQEALQENVQNEMFFMPQALTNKFVRYAQEQNLEDAYILSKSLLVQGIDLPKDDRLISEAEVENVDLGLYQSFTLKNQQECRAAQQAVADMMSQMVPSAAQRLITLGLFEFVNIINNFSATGKEQVKAKKPFVTAKYNEYKRPLSDSEARKISIQLLSMLRNYDPKKSVIDTASPFAGFDSALYSMSCYLRNENPPELKNAICNYMKTFGGSARYLLDKNVSEEKKMAKMEQILISYAYENNVEFCKFITSDKQGLNYIKINSPSLFNTIYGL